MELGALTYNLNMQHEARDVRLGARGDGDSRSRNERRNSCTVDILYACPTIPFVDVTSAAQMANKKKANTNFTHNSIKTTVKKIADVNRATN